MCKQNTLTLFLCLSALMRMSHTTLAQGVSARHTIHVSCACVFDRSSTLSSHSSFVSPIFFFILLNFDFHLFLFHVDVAGARSPSSTTTTSQRPLTFSSRSTPATRGPCMTRRSVATPSAKRSLHHCSLRSENNQRAADKLITLLKKVCFQVRRCVSVM